MKKIMVNLKIFLYVHGHFCSKFLAECGIWMFHRQFYEFIDACTAITGKSLSEALIFASTNPQYDDILFIELQVQYMKISSLEHVLPMFCKNKSFWQRFTCTEIRRQAPPKLNSDFSVIADWNKSWFENPGF